MGIITISVSDETEKKLRKLAKTEFSGGKGRLGMAVTQAIEEWADKKNNDCITRSLELLENGVNMGGMISKKRGDWHKR